MWGFLIEILITFYCFLYKFSPEYSVNLDLRNFTACNLATATLQELISE